jgi:hypothetical protein
MRVGSKTVAPGSRHSTSAWRFELELQALPLLRRKTPNLGGARGAHP